jgi:hypothetical protein
MNPGNPHDPRDPSLRGDADGGKACPPPGQPGHGCTAVLRRQQARIVESRPAGRYTDAFELICWDCGDHPYLDYSEVSSRLQRLRGPYTMGAGLAAYERHIGLAG